MSQNTYVMIDNSGRHLSDDTLHLSPEQVQQVASLHNTPLHNADGSEKQDDNLMDEIVRNLMLNNEVVDVQTSAVINQFNACVQENSNTSNNYETENNMTSASGSPKNYTSPIRNDVFLHQPNMIQDQEGLQNLQQSVQISPAQTNTTQEQMEIERFSPERLSEQFSEIQMEANTSIRPSEQNGASSFQYQSEMSNDNMSHQQQRSWRSPGEKKCMTESTSPQRNEAEILQEKYNRLTNQDDNNVGHVPLTSFGSAPQPSPRDNEQWVDGRINLQVLQRMKDIDIQMMGLQKEKMSIDSMILKLQTDKMAIDQTTLRLQNERFILLNSIMNAYPQPAATNVQPTIINLVQGDNGVSNNLTSSIVNQLGLSPISEKILVESVQATESVRVVEETKTEKQKTGVTKHRHDSSSQSKDKHKSRKRSKSREKSSSHKSSKESKDKDRKSDKKRSEHESRSHDKKHDRNDQDKESKHTSSDKSSTEKRDKSKEVTKEKLKEEIKPPKSSTSTPVPIDPLALPDAPLKKTVISSKITTPTPKPPIEAPKITIAMNTPSNVQIKTTIAKLPASIKTKVKHSFEEALSASMSPKPAPLGKKMKDLKKDIPRKGMSETPEPKTVDPITLKITDVRTVVAISDKPTPVPTEKAPKTKRRTKSNNDNPPKRRRKQETKPRATKKRRDRTKEPTEVVSVQEPAKRRRRTGKIMQMMLPDISDSDSDRPGSPFVVNEPILSEDNDEYVYLPDDFVLAANEEYAEEYNNSVAHQMSLLSKECKIVLKKIDMGRYLRKKPVDTKVESGLIISLPNSPDKTPSPTAATASSPEVIEPILSVDCGTSEDLETDNVEDVSSPTEEDFEGIPEPPVWDGKFQGHDSPIVHLKVSVNSVF